MTEISRQSNSPEVEGQLLCFVKDFFSQSHQPPPNFKPILTFPKGRDRLLLRLIGFSPHLASPVGEGQLLCFVKDFSKSIQPMNISPHLASPVGEGHLLLLLIND